MAANGEPLIPEAKGPDGLPLLDAKEKAEGSAKSVKFICIMQVVTILIGFGIAEATYFFGSKAAYDNKISLVKDYELGWAFLGAYIFAKTAAILNMYPMIYKSQIMRGKSGNVRANMYIFKMIGDKAVPGAVVLEEDGDIGRYNRANRSMHHFAENAFGMALGFFPASFIFPFPAFVCMCLFAVGRIMHQTGYAKKGYGGHGAGFGIAMLSNEALNGFLLVVALKGLDVL